MRNSTGCVVAAIALAVLALIVCVVLVYPVSVSNQIVQKDENVRASWSNVEVQLQRRFDLIDNLVGHGFRRVVLLNGHGGNIVPGQQAVFEARQRHRQRDDLLLLTATYWLLGGKPHQAE